MDNIYDLVNGEGYSVADLTHHLKMTNCGSVEFTKRFKEAERTSSFDLILFPVPLMWDEGIGFDETGDYWIAGKKSYSENGSNWYQAHNGLEWSKSQYGSGVTGEGIFSDTFLLGEYIKYIHGQDSIIIGSQHFDHGNENIDIDITNYVISCLSGATNNGLCLAFAPTVELLEKDILQYVGFFGPHTNTFFAPVVETRIKDYGSDSRNAFYENEVNRIFIDLNNPPVSTALTCTVECGTYSETLNVNRVSDKTYYIDVKITNPSSKLTYLTWNGFANTAFSETIENKKRSVDSYKAIPQTFEPSVSRVDDNACLPQGIIRKAYVEFTARYSTKKENPEKKYYKFYVKDGEKDVDVIEWDTFDDYFLINTKELLPHKYYVDIKTENNGETDLFRDVLHFEVVSNETEVKR